MLRCLLHTLCLTHLRCHKLANSLSSHAALPPAAGSLDMSPFLTTSVLGQRLGLDTGALPAAQDGSAAAAAGQNGAAGPHAMNGAGKQHGQQGSSSSAAGAGYSLEAELKLKSSYELFGVVSHRGNMQGGCPHIMIAAMSCWRLSQPMPHLAARPSP